LICPIGIGGIRSKRPEAIALSTAAQIVALDETLKVREASPAMDPANRRPCRMTDKNGWHPASRSP
jgi:xanthine/CO dehydrogenase XdhC/CoxF family maturation factor